MKKSYRSKGQYSNNESNSVLEFKLTYNDVIVQHLSQYTTGSGSLHVNTYLF